MSLKNLSQISLAFLIFFGLPRVLSASSAEWQFVVDIPGTASKAYLWIPPTCQHVRGVIVGQQVILEDKALEDPQIRQAAADEDLAVLLINPRCLGEFDYKNTSAPKILQDALDAVAADSGYAEISQAPLLSIGHSRNGIFAWALAYWNPGRVLGVVGLHCTSLPPPAYDPKASIEGVPILDISGEYETWDNPTVPISKHWRWVRGGLLALRGQHEEALVSELVDPGGCHFSFNPPMAQNVAMFIRKAAQYRLPATPPSDPTQPVVLKTIPARSGWLTDIRLVTRSLFPPAPYLKFADDPSLGFWHFDQEMAEATENFRADKKGKRDQRVTFTQDGKALPPEWLVPLKYEPLEDGITVKVSGDFLAKTPAGVADAGQPLGHAPGPIRFSLFGGWQGGGEQVGPDTFRLVPGHFGPTDNIMILAYHEGNKEYAYAEQPAELKYPLRNTEGKAQAITFPPIGDKTTQVTSLPLTATANSGLPVVYYVVRGPALVDGTTLKLTALPPRVKFPVKVTVVATQWGRAIAPLVQSAAPVEQSFLLTRP